MNRYRMRRITGAAIGAIGLAVLVGEFDTPYWVEWSLSLIGSGIIVGVALRWAGVIGETAE